VTCVTPGDARLGRCESSWPCREVSTRRSPLPDGRRGHDVVGATLTLWGGPSDSGCCSVADVDDARRVAQQLGIAHHVFNMGRDFDRTVVAPYVLAMRGPHAEPVHRVQPAHQVRRPPGARRASRLRRPRHRPSRTRAARCRRRAHRSCAGPIPTRTSPTCSPCSASGLGRVCLPVGEMPRRRAHACGELGLRTADKPDSQESASSWATPDAPAFSPNAMTCTRTRPDAAGDEVGRVDAVGWSPSGSAGAWGTRPTASAARLRSNVRQRHGVWAADAVLVDEVRPPGFG